LPKAPSKFEYGSEVPTGSSSASSDSDWVASASFDIEGIGGDCFASEIVLAEKPAITTDSDRMDRGALDQLLLHTGTLGSIYHKNPEVICLSTVLVIADFSSRLSFATRLGKH